MARDILNFSNLRREERSHVFFMFQERIKNFSVPLSESYTNNENTALGRTLLSESTPNIVLSSSPRRDYVSYEFNLNTNWYK